MNLNITVMSVIMDITWVIELFRLYIYYCKLCYVYTYVLVQYYGQTNQYSYTRVVNVTRQLLYKTSYIDIISMPYSHTHQYKQ